MRIIEESLLTLFILNIILIIIAHIRLQIRWLRLGRNNEMS